MKNKFLLTGPSPELKNYDKKYFQNKSEEGYKIVSYQQSIEYFHKIDFKPDHFCFLDPYGITCSLLRDEKLEEFILGPGSDIVCYDIYDISDFPKSPEKTKFYSSGFTCNRLYRDKEKLVRWSQFEKKLNNNLDLPLKTLNFDCKSQEDFLQFIGLEQLRKNCYFFSHGSVNPDKLTCFLLPMVINRFRDLDTIRMIAFGHFKEPRLYGGKLGYPEYMKTAETVSNIYKKMLKLGQIKIEFEIDDHNFYRDLLCEKN